MSTALTSEDDELLADIHARARLIARNVLADLDHDDDLDPHVVPCTCGAPRGQHRGIQRTGHCRITGCTRFYADPAWTIALRAVDANRGPAHTMRRWDEHQAVERAKHPRDGVRVNVSDVGSCPRAVWYKHRIETNTPPSGWRGPDPTDDSPAQAGTLYHLALEQVYGTIHPHLIHELRLPVPGLDRHTRVDLLDPVLGRVTERKSVGENAWRHIVTNANGPYERMRAQAFLEALAAARAGYDIEDVEVQIIHRDKGPGWSRQYIWPYDEKQAQAYLGELIGWVVALESGAELPRHPDRRGPGLDGLCDRCEFRSHCWDVPTADQLERTPQSVTELGADPTADAVAWAAGQLKQARAAATDAEKTKEWYATLLTGVPADTYTGGDGQAWQVIPRRQHKKDPYRRADQLEDWARLPDDQRPPLADLDYPTRVSRWVDVRPANPHPADETAKRRGRQQQREHTQGAA